MRAALRVAILHFRSHVKELLQAFQFGFSFAQSQRIAEQLTGTEVLRQLVHTAPSALAGFHRTLDYFVPFQRDLCWRGCCGKGKRKAGGQTRHEKTC